MNWRGSAAGKHSHVEVKIEAEEGPAPTWLPLSFSCETPTSVSFARPRCVCGQLDLEDVAYAAFWLRQIPRRPGRSFAQAGTELLESVRRFASSAIAGLPERHLVTICPVFFFGL